MATNLPHLPKVEQISSSPRIIRILGGNPSKFTLQGTNTYLIGSSTSRILIDTGQGLSSWSTAMNRVLADEKCTISTILLTHWHPDHVGGIPHLLSVLSPKPWIYKHKPTYFGRDEHDDATVVEQGGGREARSAAVSMMVDLLSSGSLAQSSWHDITEGQDFPIDNDGTHKLRALHTPGHTVDHMSFLLLSSTTPAPLSLLKTSAQDHETALESQIQSSEKAIKALFTGDNILGHGTAVFEDLSTYLNTLSLLGSTLPTTSLPTDPNYSPGTETPLYPGHGAVILHGQQKVAEYIAHRAQRKNEVLGALRARMGKGSGMTSMAIVKVVYAEISESLHGPAEGGVRQVLEKLEGEGRVRRGEGGQWVLVLEDEGSGKGGGDASL